MQKENIFTHKILPILSIFILVSFIFVNNCFAYSGDIVVNEYAYNLDGLQDQFIILYNINEDNLYVYLHTQTNHDLCETQRYYLWEDDNNFYLKARCDHYSKFQVLNIMKYDKDVGGFYTVSTSDLIFSLTFSKSQWKLVDIGCPVYSDENYTTLANLEDYDFFYQPPVTLAKVLEATNPTQMFQTMMRNVVVSLVACLVGFLSFRKAWAFLKAQMKAS